MCIRDRTQSTWGYYSIIDSNATAQNVKSIIATRLTSTKMTDKSSRGSFLNASFQYCPWDGYKFMDQDIRCQKCGRTRTQYHDEVENLQKKQEVKWRKILYEPQPFEDNYLDRSFLACLVSNQGQKKIYYWEVVLQTSEITYNISLMALNLVTTLFDLLI
eukprot:TRINITY_DN11547_c0_g2_i1.p1 TRINITY_DN11547_c0_g2~~TRINITY_DN11547_c0_g2_i1.p1  ORF type:complete len:160 (-),score=12.71 TRINITY_DN11547_c0_g2_i1:226-705(-)